MIESLVAKCLMYCQSQGKTFVDVYIRAGLKQVRTW